MKNLFIFLESGESDLKSRSEITFYRPWTSGQEVVRPLSFRDRLIHKYDKEVTKYGTRVLQAAIFETVENNIV